MDSNNFMQIYLCVSLQTQLSSDIYAQCFNVANIKYLQTGVLQYRKTDILKCRNICTQVVFRRVNICRQIKVNKLLQTDAGIQVTEDRYIYASCCRQIKVYKLLQTDADIQVAAAICC